MHPITLFKLFATPTQGWLELLSKKPTMQHLYMLHVIPFALIPPVMIYLSGNTHGGLLLEVLSQHQLIIVAIAFFMVELIAVPAMAVIIKQLGEVAEANATFKDAFTLAAIAPTPLFMAPLFLIFPSITLNLIITSLAMAAAAGFIYYGVPAVFKIKEEGHAKLYFGAILMAGMTAWGFLMVATLMIWGIVQNMHFVKVLAPV